MRCYFVSCLPQHPWCITDFATVWLRPSKQIRAPLYSLKQKKQRRWIVSVFESWQASKGCSYIPQIIKYGTVYVIVIVIFTALIVLRESLSLLVHCLFIDALSSCRLPQQNSFQLHPMQ